jgi:soluble lytic murein transglycosylase-like protein
MILARASKFAIVTGLAFAAMEAQADVMVIDDDGARWVAGGSTAPDSLLISVAGESKRQAMAAVYTDAQAAETTAIPIPANIIADPAAHSARVPARYVSTVDELARRFDLSPALLEAVVWQESRWRETAVSPAGARGLAQLMPGTAKYLGVDPDDPMANLEGGARYLREQLDRFDGDLEKALAAYNAGPGRVIRAGGVPNIRETKHYVAAILGRLADHSRPAAP